MRRVAVSLVAVFTVIVLALAFAGCECACDDDGADLCLVSCACHGASLAAENPSLVESCSDRQAYRPGDVQLILPLAVADIFNPPKV